PVDRDQLGRDQDGSAERGHLDGASPAWHESDRDRKRRGRELDDRQQPVERRVLPPDAEGRVAAELEADRLAVEDTQATLLRNERNHERDRHDREHQAESEPRPAPRLTPATCEEGRERERRELGGGGKREQAAARAGGGDRQQREHE